MSTFIGQTGSTLFIYNVSLTAEFNAVAQDQYLDSSFNCISSKKSQQCHILNHDQ